MPECENCGEHVSETFKRVLGIDGEVRKCISCTGRTEAIDPARTGDP